MCQDREHQYRITVRVGNREAYYLVFYAKGLIEALAKADGFCAVEYPNEGILLTGHHAGYNDPASAVEHGAILPEDYHTCSFSDEINLPNSTSPSVPVCCAS
jgi:hypothetical protein